MKILIKFEVPFRTFITGPTPESLNLETDFIHKKCAVKIKLLGKEPLTSDSSPEKEKHFKEINNIAFQIEETEKSGQILNQFVRKSQDYTELFIFLVEIRNRILRGVRNSGFCPDIHEIYPDKEKIKSYLLQWNVQFSSNGTKWEPFISPPGLLEAFLLFQNLEFSNLHIDSWPDVEEAIQDNLEPPPEQEFLVNAIEYRRQHNYRLALLESIIALEIVLAEYLNAYLSITKQIPKGRIGEVLSPQVGLTAKISVLLNLTLNDKDLSKIKFDNILKAIEYRNKVIHKVGHLPKGIDEKEIHENILSVLELVSILAERRNQIKASPELQSIGKQISEKYLVPLPSIWKTGHGVFMKFSFFFKPFPEKEKLKIIAEEASVIFSKLDNRFNSNKDLFIQYVSFPPDKVKARWRNGQLEELEI